MFTPPGLPAFEAQQANLAAQASGGFDFGAFAGGVLEIGRDVGASILQLDLFNRTLDAQVRAQQAGVTNATSGTATTTSAASSVSGSGDFTVQSLLTNPMVISVAVVVLILLVLLMRSK